MDTVLITGGAGYIGIHTAIALSGKKYRILIIDSLVNSSKKSIERLNKNILSRDSDKSQIIFKKGDIRDINFLRSIFKNELKSGNIIKYVLHFAGLKSISDSTLFPDEYWDVNVIGTERLLKVMKENNCRNFVFSSSATVYSLDEKSPLKENSSLSPNNQYGFTKLTVEKFLERLVTNQKSFWKIICLRYFNPIGAHPSGDFGESPLNTPNNLFPYLCQVAAKKRAKLYIFGQDWPTSDGTCIRDYIHVMDLAEGHIAAIDYIRSGAKEPFLVINLGTGLGTSVLELVQTFEKVNNLKIDYEFIERREKDRAIVYADPNFARRILKWEAKRNIFKMCKDGWNWQKKNPNGY